MRKRIERSFKSIFAEHLINFIEMRQRIGYKDKEQGAILFRFDRFLSEANYQGPLSQELAWEFATSRKEISRNECARHYHAIRQFSDYLAVFNPETPPLLTGVLKSSKTRPPVHIYTGEELTRLLDAAKHASRINPLRGITLHAMVGLAASTGLRISEVVTLDRGEVNLETGILTIRRTKFQKDRLVPVHPTTLKVLRDYATLRDAHFPELSTPAFFIHMWGGRFSKHTLGLAFYNLACDAGLRKAVGRGPHFHDLRHTFAVKRLISWYREGRDVQALLPLLATYMGHVHYSETAYYLTATSELLGLAAERYDAFLMKEEVKA